MGVVESIVGIVGKSIAWTTTFFLASLFFLVAPRLSHGEFDPIPPQYHLYVILVCVICGAHVLVSLVRHFSEPLTYAFVKITRSKPTALEMEILEILGARPTKEIGVDEINSQTTPHLEIVHACNSLFNKGYVGMNRFSGKMSLTFDGETLLVKRLQKERKKRG